MKIGKPKSKRVPVRLRHKIEKASASKQRKQRKAEKTNPQWRSRLKKDPGIPNLFPYKAKLLAEIEEGKRRKAEEQIQKRELAKARRQGDAAGSQSVAVAIDRTVDQAVVLQESEEEEMDVDDQNPMAALLASAQARAHTYDEEGDDVEHEDEEDEDDDAWDGLDADASATQPQQDSKKALPRRALDDPVKAVTLLVNKMQSTAPNGIQVLTEYYQLPPLVASTTDMTTRLLVEVARKRGRLGRGGIPNLHAAALVLLNDVHDERLQLPSEMSATTKKTGPSSVTIVKSMSAPFKLEGLWGDKPTAVPTGNVMVVDS